MFLKLPIDGRGNTVTVGIEHIAYVCPAPAYQGTGSLIHLGVKVLQYEKRVKLAVVYTTLTKDRVDEMIDRVGGVIQDYKPGHMYGRGNF